MLDVGSGGYPFPLATVHMDGYPGFSPSRYEPLAPVEKPFVMGDVHNLPFRDQSFEFLYRVPPAPVRRGSARCVRGNDAGRQGRIHRDSNFWQEHVVLVGQRGDEVVRHRHSPAPLLLRYTDRELEGVRSPIWRDLIMSRWYEPLQAVFYDNQDIFNTMFSWTGSFSVSVFGRDGSVRTLNATAELNPHARDAVDSDRLAEFTVKAHGS